MNIHKNARLTPIGRERLVQQVESGQTPEAAARAAGVCLHDAPASIAAMTRTRRSSDNAPAMKLSRNPRPMESQEVLSRHIAIQLGSQQL